MSLDKGVEVYEGTKANIEMLFELYDHRTPDLDELIAESGKSKEEIMGLIKQAGEEGDSKLQDMAKVLDEAYFGGELFSDEENPDETDYDKDDE